jgi:hypothetical protein
MITREMVDLVGLHPTGLRQMKILPSPKRLALSWTIDAILLLQDFTLLMRRYRLGTPSPMMLVGIGKNE